MLCGSSPVAASSGKTIRYRLNRGGNRQANAAVYRIVLVRLRYHQPTKDYVDRRTSEGKSKPEIIRCLKRYVAREVYTALKQTRRDEPRPSPLTSIGASPLTFGCSSRSRSLRSALIGSDGQKTGRNVASVLATIVVVTSNSRGVRLR
jgi:Transposase IS116/IS110/IS902 family